MLDKLFLSVLNMSIIAGLVILAVLLVRFLLKKAPKIFSYALWAVVLVRLLCPFSFESAIGLLPINGTPIPRDIVYSTAPQINTGLTIVDDIVNPILPIPNIGEDSVNQLQIWVFVGSVIWAIGILTMLIYSIIQFVRLKRKLIASTPLRDNIYLADHINSPFVMGLFKPKIYLPSALSDIEKDFIVSHEMCHVRRFDHITRILGFIALAIHWFNPLVWVAFILSEKDMEMSCDEAVMKQMNTDIRTEYSQSLLRFATGKTFIAATPLAFGEGDTKDRVKNVLTYKKPAFWVIVVSVLAIVAVGVGLMANPKNNPILIHESNKVTSISIEQINESESLGIVQTADKNEIETILKVLQNTNKTMQESVNDSPNRDAYFQININGSDSRKFYLYNDKKQYFIEEPYGGIYKTNRETSVSIAKIYTAYGDATVEKLDISVEKLWKNRTEYVGDNAAVGNILSELNFPEKLKYNGFQLFTEQQPYSITVNFTTDTKTRNFYTGALHQTPLKQNAIILFSLIENVDTVNFNLDDSKNPYSESFYRESAQAIMQNDNLFATTETVEGFSDFIKEIPNRLNAGTAILTHDQAVASALFSLANNFPMGECVAEGHIILGYDDSDKNETKIYALTAMSKYNFENGNFVEVSGSAFPAVITLFSDNRVEIEKPLDGSYNTKSIKEMFPKEYHDKVFKYGDTERDILKQQREKYASEYLAKIGREAKIGDYSDFDYTSLTDVGVSVEASNNLQVFYKAHNYYCYPSFIGTSERLENGVRMVYEMSYEKNQDEIRFTKYDYDTKQIMEQFAADAYTGNIVQ